MNDSRNVHVKRCARYFKTGLARTGGEFMREACRAEVDLSSKAYWTYPYTRDCNRFAVYQLDMLQATDTSISSNALPF